MKKILLYIFIAYCPILSSKGMQKDHFYANENNSMSAVKSTNDKHGKITGTVSSRGKPVAFANIVLRNTKLGTTSDKNGNYTISNVPKGKYRVRISYLGFKPIEKRILLKAGERLKLDFDLEEDVNMVDEVVVTGTLKEVKRLDSPVPVETYNPTFFKKNPTPNIFEALQNVNGVRPQINCQVCNTGDIHINGLEGPYTMVLIDGMPIVSSLSTVYGLMGIPNSLVERIEIVKGPASSLYGSEAIAGLINIITKNTDKAPKFSVDAMGTTWGEYNLDLGVKFNFDKKTSSLFGINYYNFDNVIDNNKDNFTDKTIQERVSLFQKWNFKRKHNRLFTLAGRLFWEDRWGGDLRWNRSFRGGNKIYGESIITERLELIGNYQLPIAEKLMFSFSLSSHDQDSFYGDSPYDAIQQTAFGQLTWDKKAGIHNLLFGSALRYRFYDDNTPATGEGVNSEPEKTWLPGLFAQDEISINDKHKVLLGARYDYHNEHGSIFTPRLAYKWSISDMDIIRLNAGTGFRVVNLFTEDHASYTGARDVIVSEELKPEESYNANLSYVKKIYLDHGGVIRLDAAAWYTHFTNAIIPDYDTNDDQIIYSNLDGYAVTKGLSVDVDLSLSSRFSTLLGFTFMDVSKREKDNNGIRRTEKVEFAESFSGNWAISYKFLKNNQLKVDYTGSVYGPMKLTLVGDLDPRPEYSPFWSIQNIQITYKGFKNIEIYGGVKNLLNWTPWKSLRKHQRRNNINPPVGIISRPDDPFDERPEFNNPYNLSFDPTYVFAPNQGIRGFIGIRYSF